MKDILKILLKIPKFKRRFMVFVLSVILAQGVAQQVLPLVDRQVTELIQLAVSGQKLVLNDFYILFMIAALTTGFLLFFQRLSFFVANILREDVWDHIFRAGFSKILYHDLAFIGKERSGSLLNKIDRAANKICNLFTDAASVFFRNITKATVSLAIIFVISWQIGVLIIITVILYAIIYYLRFKVDIPLAKDIDKFADKEFSRIWEVVPQVKIAKIFSNESQEVVNVKRVRKKLKDNTIKREWLWVWANLAQFPLVNLPTILIKFYAAWLAISGHFGIPTFVLLYTLISVIQEPLWVINWFMWEMQDTIYRSKKYLEILLSKEEVTDPIKPQKITNPNGDIIFNQVSLSYKHGQSDVLNQINLKFAGQKITALVGKSGAGKSTITNLICRFYDPSEGQITLDGISLKNFSKSDLRKQIGFVMQESFVFSGTIGQNMRYAKANATLSEIKTALKKAQAWEFVSRFKKGIHTQIGERGIKLSGGQKQRLSIARTILKNPRILILDEATNALDSESEVLVQKALENFMQDRTVIMIAHRLSTIAHADQIYVIDNGQVEEAGTHQELIKLGKTYKMLHDIQAGGFTKQKKIMEEYELG